MLTFYYAPNSCSTAAHIVLEEAGAEYEAVKVDFSAAEQHGPDFRAVNPRGKVPVLRDGEWTVTENVAIQFHLTERFPDAGLRPSDPVEQVRWLSTLCWLASTVQPDARHITRPENYSDDPATHPALVAKGHNTLTRLMGELDGMLAPGPWILGANYSTADPYALVFTGVAKKVGVDLSPFRNIVLWVDRCLSRPAVRKILAMERNVLLEPPGIGPTGAD